MLLTMLIKYLMVLSMSLMMVLLMLMMLLMMILMMMLMMMLMMTLMMMLMMLWCCKAVLQCSRAWLKGRLTNVWSIAAILRDAQCCTNTLGPNTNTHGNQSKYKHICKEDDH